MARPILDNFDLPLVQTVEGGETEALEQHAVPALEGDFLQDLGRRAVRYRLDGVMVGSGAAAALKTLREKYRAATPVKFVADIATATKVDTVLIEEMETRDIAGRPERTEYKLGLVEFIQAPPPHDEPPPPPPPKPLPTTASLVVTVIVDDDPNFDFSNTTVQLSGGTIAGSLTLTSKLASNIWTDDPIDPGTYTATASVTTPTLTGSASVTVPPAQKARVVIHLREGPPVAVGFVVHYWFDKALVEPCLRGVLRQVAAFAQAHPDQMMLIVGHTDLVGSVDYNQALSERRARGVFAYLTSGRAHDAAVAEWDALRRHGSAITRLEDNWGVREYQQMLSGLGDYHGAIDGLNGPLTDQAVRQFQTEHGLAPDGVMGDATWRALIDAYLSADALAVPESQFFSNCPGEIVKWLGCGEQDFVRNTTDAWRPNRRTDIVFVKASTLPGPIGKPVTFNLPAPGAVNSNWCVGGDNDPRAVLSHNAPVPNTFFVQPAEPGNVTVKGHMTFEDTSPAGGIQFVLTAPDGTYLSNLQKADRTDAGEVPAGPDRGKPIPPLTTDADGSFSHAAPTGIGIYILSVLGGFTVRLKSDPPNSGTSPVLCTRLDGTQDFDVVVTPQ
jgi:outer membrane protein OmpA-like peptidoglycan-associated protein